MQDTTQESIKAKKKNVKICRRHLSKENAVVKQFKDKIKKVHLFEKLAKTKHAKKVSIDRKTIENKENKKDNTKRRGSLIDLINNYESSSSSSCSSPLNTMPPWTRESMLERVRSIRM